jgi:hypothetical protein
LIVLNKNCQVCGSKEVKVLLDFGLQPICNRFSSSPYEEDYYHPLILAQCQNCNLIQLTDPVPVDEIVPRVEWLKYNEPEEHLDDLANIVSTLEEMPEKPIACGITYKDDSLLKLLEERSFGKTWRIEPEQDLGIIQKGVAGETIIPKLTTDSVKNITDKYGYVDVLVARHILEHAIDTQAFLSLIWNIIKPGGYIVFEVPDCTKQLENKDYSMPWEEHILYFVPETLKSTFVYTSYELVQLCQYPYKTEDSQVVIVRKPQVPKRDDIQPIPKSFKLAVEYADSFEKNRRIIYSYLKEYTSKIGKVAFYGAGHLSVMLVKSLQLEDFIEFVVDDTEKKQNLYLPGTSLQIKSSSQLEKENISLCVMSLSVEHENIIVKKHHGFIAGGGTFVSAFPMQHNSLFKIASEIFQI